MDSAKFDSELPTKMAGLDIMEVDGGSPTGLDKETMHEMSGTESRILRKRKSLLPETTKSSNRRVSMKPKKRVMPESSNPKQIEALYLNKTVKHVSQTLETIFEEPKTDSTSVTFIGGRKVKRLLTFPVGNMYTKDKIKKRRAKIKKLLGNKSFLNRKKIPMQVFRETLECLDLDEPILSENNPA